MYSIRAALSRDVKGTLTQITGFGYRELEIYGYDGKYYGFAPKEFRAMLDDLGLRSPSGHYTFDEYYSPAADNDKLLRYVDLCITGAHTLGQQYIVWPWVDPAKRNPETFKKIIDQLNIIGDKVTNADLQFAYHNHDFEFINQDGEQLYNLLLQRTDPEKVKLELDLYWATYMKQDLKTLFTRHPGRFPLWHLKDKDKQDPSLHTFMGNGDIDFKAILLHAAAAGVQHMYVEQGNNYVPDDMECVRRSAIYVKARLMR